MSPTRKPLVPAFISSSVLALSALRAATVFSSKAFASDAVPWANAACENVIAMALSTPIIRRRNIAFLLGYLANLSSLGIPRMGDIEHHTISTISWRKVGQGGTRSWQRRRNQLADFELVLGERGLRLRQCRVTLPMIVTPKPPQPCTGFCRRQSRTGFTNITKCSGICRTNYLFF